MKVFFNHIAKCGGTSINKIAKNQYQDDFHILTPSTSIEELQVWLNKETFFISSELFHISIEAISLILKDTSIKRVVLSRDPIDRFKSFLAHTNRNPNGDINGLSFWGHSNYILHPIN